MRRRVVFTYTDPDGNTFTDSPPDAVKGSGKQQGVWCTFSFDFESGNGLESFSGGGEVYLKITPAPPRDAAEIRRRARPGSECGCG